MTENHAGLDGYGAELTRRRQLAEWKQQKKAEAEQERIAGLRAEMDRYREERLTDWMAHGGDPATFSQVWPSMMKDYLDTKQLEREGEREAKMAESIAQNYPYGEEE
jgi:hypothetical protein